MANDEWRMQFANEPMGQLKYKWRVTNKPEMSNQFKLFAIFAVLCNLCVPPTANEQMNQCEADYEIRIPNGECILPMSQLVN